MHVNMYYSLPGDAVFFLGAKHCLFCRRIET